MKVINLPKNGFGQRIVGTGIALVVLMVVAVIVGTIENSTTWTQSLSSTIGDYIEPLALLGGLVVAGMMASGGTR